MALFHPRRLERLVTHEMLKHYYKKMGLAGVNDHPRFKEDPDEWVVETTVFAYDPAPFFKDVWIAFQMTHSKWRSEKGTIIPVEPMWVVFSYRKNSVGPQVSNDIDDNGTSLIGYIAQYHRRCIGVRYEGYSSEDGIELFVILLLKTLDTRPDCFDSGRFDSMTLDVLRHIHSRFPPVIVLGCS
jgi:hypothetical protein